jgi:uncharacterized repeat protein (TIGR02059 family)
VNSESDSKVILRYDDILDSVNLPNSSAFTVTVDDQAADISSVSASGEIIELELDDPIRVLQVVKISYTYDGPSDRATRESTTNPAIQDPAGNDALNLSIRTVRNDGGAPDTDGPVFQTAETDDMGRKIVVTFDEVLQSSKAPATGSFSVAVNSGTAAAREIGMSSLSINGRSV